MVYIIKPYGLNLNKTNPLLKMAISYPVDVANTRWAVIKQSTGEIIARNEVWPRPDGAAISGLDPDFVYLLDVRFLASSHAQYVAPPNYDSRLYYLQSVETPDIPNNILDLEYEAIKRDEEEQIEAAKNKEVEELTKQIDITRELIETRLAVSALTRIAHGQGLPQKAQSYLSGYAEKGVKLWNNRGRLDEILTDIQSGIEPNLDAGWENA